MAKKVRRPNVKDGVLAPLGNGFAIAIGKHPEKTDDIDIGPNNKNGLSVNHGEILQQKGNTVRVFSAEPMFGGVSPAQLLYGGMAPDKVFAMQEQYKQAHRINDDGTHYKTGGKTQTPIKKGVDWSGIKTTNNRSYNPTYIEYINNGLVKAGVGKNQRAAILANIIEESGGNPFAVDSTGKFKGLLQWEESRYWPGDETDIYKELDNQIKYIVDSAGNATDKKSWTHGGKGSGYNSLKDAIAAYNAEDDLAATMRGYTLGYVRPAGGIDSYNNRYKVAEQLINREGFKNGGIYIKPSKRGTFTAAANKHGMSVQSFANKVLANKDNYSPSMVKKANFAHNASKWHHLFGGEDSLINPLGERPNAKFGKEMKNKRTKSLTGTQVNLITAGANNLASLIGAGIQQGAISGMEFTPRIAAFYNPVKLKTKINIEPQIAKLKEMQAQLADAARRTSGSSREAYRRILAGHNSLLESAMGLYGQKENQETSLINQDILNQQGVAHKNTKEHFDTLNYNLEGTTNLRNQKGILSSNNWTTALNTTAGAWKNFVDSENARRVKAAELYTQAIANPDSARLIYGDIDFKDPAKRKEAMDAIYNYLNNQRLG